MISFVILVLLIIVAFAFSRIDCNVYLWILDKFTRPASKLSGKVVWITGASSGIGEYVAYELAKAGCRLALSGTNEDRLSAVKRKCIELTKADESSFLLVPFNITDVHRHRACMDRVLNHFKEIDILFNNAGRSQRASFETIELEVDKDMFDVNVFGPLNLTRLVLNWWYKRQHDGHIAVTSSVAGLFGAPFSATYCGTKFALHGYFETLRVEGYLKGIRITLLCPGPVFSRILETSFTSTKGVTVNQSHDENANRMSTERCARLCTVAVANKCNVAWITIQPILVVLYLAQYLPWLKDFIMTRMMTEKKLMAIREGK